jgi:hypothetical protein
MSYRAVLLWRYQLEAANTWFVGAINKDMVDGFTVQAFFALVEAHDGELEENILQQITKVDWRCWCHLSPNNYQIDFKTFIPKVCRCFEYVKRKHY